jgi:hypothetical protein
LNVVGLSTLLTYKKLFSGDLGATLRMLMHPERNDSTATDSEVLISGESPFPSVEKNFRGSLKT